MGDESQECRVSFGLMGGSAERMLESGHVVSCQIVSRMFDGASEIRLLDVVHRQITRAFAPLSLEDTFF